MPIEKIYKLKESQQHFKINYHQDLNPVQLEIVKNADGPCLVIAGPGSGKTRILIYRVAYLIQKGVDPTHIMLVTFTNKAAREMLFRLETLLGYFPKGIIGGTFHHIANLILRKHAVELNFKSNFTIIDEDDSKELLKECISSLNIDTKTQFFPKPEIIQDIISFARNSSKTLRETIEDKYEQFSHIIDNLIAISNLYKKKKQKLNIMDFDDLLINLLKLLKENEQLKKNISQNLHYILVDEFQDTNIIQSELIYTLAQEHQNITVVGDDCQSIYSFRGATVQNILEFPKRYPNHKIFKLEENYRSTKPILRITNLVLKNIINKFEKKLITRKSSPFLPKIVRTHDVNDQAKFVAQRILEIREENNVSLNDIAVLFRSSYQSMELELFLNRFGIPYIKRGGLKFFEQAHIKDILAFLKILLNNQDQISWLRIFNLFAGIGRQTALKIWTQLLKEGKENIKNFIAIDLNKTNFSLLAKASLNNLFNILKDLLLIKEPAPAIKTIFDSFYKDYVTFNFKDAEERLSDIKELISFTSGRKSIKKFVEEATLDENFKGETLLSENSETNDEKIILTTIHQAKGLEWKIVFIIHLNEEHFPHAKCIKNPDLLDEERRLFYVATSRAQDDLYISRFETYKDYKGYRVFAKPSRFIEELDQDAYEVWNVN